MIRLSFLVLVFVAVEAQSPLADENSPDAVTNFQPSIAVVIGILCVMFALTFILLIYAKFCHRGGSARINPPDNGVLTRSGSRYSGIDKTVIESLPFFRFSSLKGSKEGLECAVCLSKFEDIEILRMLPKCKHAFHVNCVDQWLEKHSSCPLCRHKVSAEDPTIFTYSNSMRFSWNQSEAREEGSNVELQLFVQREEQRHGSSRFSIGSSFRKIGKGNKEEELPIKEADDDSHCDQTQKVLHKFNHKIVVSDVVFKNRWSSVSSSDLMLLNSEMLNHMSSDRFSTLDSDGGIFTAAPEIRDEHVMSIKEEMERKRLFESKAKTSGENSPFPNPGFPSTSVPKSNSNHTSKVVDPAERRVMSEITAVSRFGDFGVNRIRAGSLIGNNPKEERTRRLWLPIARRTVQWFANRETTPQQTEKTRQQLHV